MIHISGFERSQLLLLPEAVDDYVGPLAGAGFRRVEPKATGRPGYVPGECHRNIEVAGETYVLPRDMWRSSGSEKARVQDRRLSLVLGLDLDAVHGVGHHSVGMRVRIPAVVSDLRAMPDTPNVRLTAVSMEPTLISTVLFAGGRRMDRLL
jgi:hypothetical protein